MKIKYYIIIVALIFLSLLILFGISSQKNNEQTVKIETCDGLASGKLKTVCYAVFLRNYTYCNLATDFSSYCYDSVFPLIDVNQRLCEGLDDKDAKLPCYVSLAVKEKNATLCEDLQDSILTNICYTRLADYIDVLNDIKFCEKIPHESTKFLCMARITGDINYCSNITLELVEKGFCLAAITKNVDDCFVSTSSSEASSRITFSSCIQDVAVKTKNMTMCDMAGRVEDEWKCKMALSNNVGICNQTEEPWKDLCIIEYLKNNLV